uniref:EPM2A-interacting protein 1 n=1 Tax=Cacopsylla melanoneura TaxID=428564 RepID=A0A8D8LD06_9HEMI
MSNVNGFRNKLKLFLSNIDNNDLTYFKHCREVVDEFPDDLIDFSMFKTNIKEIMDEFDRIFVDSDRMKDSIVLYRNPMNSVIEQQESKYQMELCDLQADTVFQTRKEVGPEFFKLLDKERFPNLRSFGQKITSMFGSSYVCESAFSTMKHVKNQLRNKLTDVSLAHLLRLGIPST